MESKPKVRQVRKVVSAPRKRRVVKKENFEKPKSVDALIRFNGELVESFFASPVWNEIISPLLQESVASVSGRLTNNRYYDGEFTRGSGDRLQYLSGYQKALMDFHNRLDDFIVAKNQLKDKKKQEELNKNQPFYNPFLEDDHDQESD